MRHSLATTVSLVLLIAAGSACHSSRHHDDVRYSDVEGFGIAGNEVDAKKLAWDDAITRAEKIGYTKFDVVMRGQSSSRANFQGNVSGVKAMVRLRVYPHEASVATDVER